MKVLMLDIDGVLNSSRSCVAFNGYPHDYDEKGMSMFDHCAIALIRKLCKETETDIVLSSTWRIHEKNPMVHADGLSLPIIDCTPVLSRTRGVEINAWLAAHPEVTCYAIVDDNSDMLPAQRPYFVQTDFNAGLSLENYLDLKKILTAGEHQSDILIIECESGGNQQPEIKEETK